MLDVSKLLEEIKASPYEELVIKAPHTGVVSFDTLSPGVKVLGPTGTWKEKPGTRLAIIERESNPKPLFAPLNGVIDKIHEELADSFVEAGTPLVTLKHYLSKDEVLEIILKRTLHPFMAPERAKYYFVPEVDKKVIASGPKAVRVNEGMELFIMSRMKRETGVSYTGPTGLIYAVYFKHNEVVDAGQPLIGVCPPDLLHLIEDVVVRVKTEWEERD
ncbi:MAG: biotin attachment protein [Desulfovibrio sp.]|nr:MAG: biotin attachment protein [Desulfovibrio sp.]